MTSITDTSQPLQGSARIGPFKAIPEILRSFGLDPAELLAELDLDLSLFADSDNVIPFKVRGRLLHLCVARTGCAHFGLLLGQHGNLSSLGLIGYLARQSEDVLAALTIITRFTHLHVRGASITIEHDQTTAFFGYSIYNTGIEGREQFEDGAAAICFNIMKQLCGPQWTPASVAFAHKKPPDAKPHQRFFRAPLSFDAEQSGVLFPSAYLRQRLTGTDTELRAFLAKQVAVLEQQHRDDFVGKIRQALHYSLLSKRASATDIARIISVHPRSLQRRLAAHNTSFKQLRNEVSCEMARQLLEDTDREIGQIAFTLGYADASAFTRAFRRWTGLTPGNWRRRARDVQPPLTG